MRGRSPAELSPPPACFGPQEQIELLKTPGLGDTATSALEGLCRIFSGRAPRVTRSRPRPRQPRPAPIADDEHPKASAPARHDEISN